MKITEVEVRKLFTYGQYKNVSFGYKAEVEGKEQPDKVKIALLDKISEDWTDFIGNEERIDEERRVRQETDWVISRKEDEIKRLEKKIEKMREFLSTHGVEILEPDFSLPF